MVLKAQQQGRNKVPKQRGRGSRGSQRGTVVPTRSREMANDSRRGLGASLSVAGSGPLDALPQFSLPQITNAVLNQRLLIAVLALTAYAVLTVDSDASRGWYFDEVLYRLPLDNWRSYEVAVAEDPVPIKAAITGVTYLIGDWLAQANSLTKEGRSWLDVDRARLFRATAVGTVLLGPLAHFYYDFVATLDTWPTFSKIVLDQTAYLSFYNTVYYVALLVLGGKSVSEACGEYKGRFWLLLTSGWKLWPLVGIVTYTLIPQQNRVLWIDMIEIVYSALLSTLTNEGEE